MSGESLNIGWSGVYTAGVGALGTLLALFLKSKMEERREKDKEGRDEKRGVVASYGELVDRLQKQLDDSQEDRNNLWKMFREMQEALAAAQGDLRMAQARADDCELLHRADAIRISSLEKENLVLHSRVNTLEGRLNIDPNKSETC